MTIEAHEETRSFFHERLRSALRALGVEVSDHTELYLLELLTRGGALATPDQPLFERLAAALASSHPRERLQRFRDTGDAALYTCGFFAEHIEKRGMSQEYYCTLGARAYRAAGGLSPVHGDTFHELADGFRELAQVFDEVREETTLRTPQDIVRLYDRWRRTGSTRIADRLRREGVFPQKPGGSIH